MKRINCVTIVSGLITIIVSSIWSQSFLENWDGPGSSNFYYGSGGNKQEFTHTIGATSSIESNTKILSLKTDPNEAPGAWQGPNMTSNQICKFGTYVARIKIPDASSQPNVGSVVGFYTYYNDEYGTTQEADINGNGIYDNSEIDFEWLIADPKVIYITAYTDYSSVTGETRKIGRVINLAEGTIYKTEYATTLGGVGTPLTGNENYPSTIEALPSYDASRQFYTYGFDWHSDGIRWWMINPENSDTIVLWDYKGPIERITQKPAYLMLNIWHTNNWPVITNPLSTEAPNKQFEVEFDWVSYTPQGTTASIDQITSSKQNLNYRITKAGNLIIKNSINISNSQIQLFNMNGQLVKCSLLKHINGSDITLPLNDISAGYYLWTITSDKRKYSGSFIYK